MPDLNALLNEAAAANALEIVRICDEQRMNGSREVAFTAWACGAQFGLELAQLSPNIARDLIMAIHRSQPDAADEWNRNAAVFIRRAREAHV